MNVDCFLVSQNSIVGQDGNLNIIGVFERIFVNVFPALVPSIGVTAVMHGARREAGTEHVAELVLLNRRREPVGNTPIQVRFTFPAEETVPEGIPLRHTLSFNATGLLFPEPGPYAFELSIDGIYSAGAAFHVGLQPQV